MCSLRGSGGTSMLGTPGLLPVKQLHGVSGAQGLEKW